jgi:hypothetical protein
VLRVVVDVDSAGGVHTVDFEDGDLKWIDHPNGSGVKVSIKTMLAYHNDHPDARELGGWHVLSQLAGEPEPITRWQRLVNACNHQDAHKDLKALGLK